MAGNKNSGNYKNKKVRQLTPRIQEEARNKINTTVLIQKLLGHALMGLPMSVTQLKAAEILLKKTLPDLSSVEIKAEIEAIRKDISDRPLELTSESWVKKHKEVIDVTETVN